MTDLADLTLVQAADAVRTGEATSRDLLDAIWARMDAVNPQLNAVIWLDREAAEQAARAADQAVQDKRPAGQAAWRAAGAQGHVLPGGQALHLRVGAAPRLPARPHRDGDGADGRRRCLYLRRAEHGGVRAEPHRPQPHLSATATIRGTCRTSPAVRRPVPARRSAARFNYAALGSDTGGSIRLPASACGVTGIKPTQTRVSRAGVMPLSFSCDNVGPLARTARDCARVLAVIAGRDDRDPTCARLPVPDYEAGAGWRSFAGCGSACRPRISWMAWTHPVLAAMERALEVLAGARR